MTTVLEMMQERSNLVQEGRAIIDRAEAEGRDLVQEEQNRYDAIMNDVTSMTTRLQRLQRQEALETENRAPVTASVRPEPGNGRQAAERVELRSRAFQGLDEIDPGWRDNPEWRNLLTRTGGQDYGAAFGRFLRTGQRNGLMAAEQRALQADADIYGGYLYPPVQFVDRLIQAVDNAVFVRNLATVMAVANAESVGVPSLDNDPADPTWTSELLIGSEDSTMSFGGRELNPHPLAKYIKVSRKLLRKVPSAESLVIQRLSYKFGVVAENAYLNGPGANQPLGVFTASNQGISTSRDVSTGNTTTSMQFDGLKTAKYTMKAQYWPEARWCFHRDGVAQIAKLKDGSGRYLWQDSVTRGEPDTLLEFPVDVSEYAPNTFTTGLYVGILAAWRYYWIADALAMEFQRLDELYAATNQVGFIGRLESDGMPVLEEAFVRVKLA